MVQTVLKPFNWNAQQIYLSVPALMLCIFRIVSSTFMNDKAEAKLGKFGIIPGVIDVVPKFLIDKQHTCHWFPYEDTFFYGRARNSGSLLQNVSLGHHTLRIGQKVNPAFMQKVPNVSWPAQPGALFTLLMIDPDVPVRENPCSAERLHWIVGNIPGWNFYVGDDIVDYIGPWSPKNTGLHRTTFLTYSQNSLIKFDEQRLTIWDRSYEQRYKFSARKFAEKYNLTIYAVNFFRTGWPLRLNSTQLKRRNRKPFSPRVRGRTLTTIDPFLGDFAPPPEKMEM